MTDILMKLLEMSLSASIVIVAVLFVRLILKRAPKVFSYLLWSIALFRLLCPFTFESAASLMPAQVQQVPQTVVQRFAPSRSLIPSPVPIPTPEEQADVLSAPEQEAAPIEGMDILAWIWFMGMAGLLGHAGIRYLLLKRRLSTATHVEGNLYQTDRINTSFVLGMIRPKIYMPVGMDAQKKVFVIMHERAHIRSLDFLIKPLGYLSLALHWFNPLVWVGFRMMARDMELACDERVLRTLDQCQRSGYAHTLLSVSAQQSQLAGALAFGQSSVSTRVKHVMRFQKPPLWATFSAVMVVIIMVVGFMANPALGTVQESSPIQLSDFIAISINGLASNETFGQARGEIIHGTSRYPYNSKVGIDLDGNGREEAVMIALDDRAPGVFSIYIDGKWVRHAYSQIDAYDGFAVVDIDTKDPYVELVISDGRVNGDSKSYFYRYTGQDIVYMNEDCNRDLPGQDPGRMRTIEGMMSDLTFSGDGRVTGIRASSLIQSFWVTVQYGVTQDHRLRAIPQPDGFQLAYSITSKTLAPLPLFNQRDAGSGMTMMEAGQTVTFIALDDLEWVKLALQDGRYGWLRMKDGDVILNGGELIQANQVFDRFH